MTPSEHRHHWQLADDLVFLNHGSFGATPTVVLDAQRAMRNELESDLIRVLAPERDLIPRLDAVRQQLAGLVGAEAEDIAFVRNATDGVNAVLRSFAFEADDEVLVTNHGYNACSNVVDFATNRAGARMVVVELPFPLQDPLEMVAAIEAAFTDRTRLLLVDHITSPTGLILPLEEIVRSAKARGIRVMVDGAHAPGQIPLDLGRLAELGVDYYTANHHKWLCAPKASGFLWVRRELQHEVRPTVISHGHNRPVEGRSRFLCEFDWPGTYDPTPILSLGHAIDFVEGLLPGGLAELMQRNHALALEVRGVLVQRLGLEAPAPDEMIGSLSALRFAEDDAVGKSLQPELYREHRIEVPVFRFAGRWMIRTSSQAYNHLGEADVLCDAILLNR